MLTGGALLIDTGTGSSTSTDPSVVVFDLVSGVSSSHSSTTFDPNTAYDIYIRVDSDSYVLNSDNEGGTGGTWNRWSGGDNLGSDDTVTLVGDGSAVLGPWGTSVTAQLITTTTTTTTTSTTTTTTTSTLMAWATLSASLWSAAALLWSTGDFTRRGPATTTTSTTTFPQIRESTFSTSLVSLWTGSARLSGMVNTAISSGHLTTMPAGVLTSQGLV